MEAKGRQSKEQVEKMAREAVEEARMVLPGIQTLFGFQLIAVFNERFRQLHESQQRLHFLAILMIAVAIALIMTPAAYHRMVEPGGVSSFFVRLASRLIALAMVPLMVALCVEVYILATVVFSDHFTSVALGLSLFAVFAGLWLVLPAVMIARNRS